MQNPPNLTTFDNYVCISPSQKRTHPSRFFSVTAVSSLREFNYVRTTYVCTYNYDLKSYVYVSRRRW